MLETIDNCVLSLMLHKMSYQISVIYRAQTFSKCKRQSLPSSLGHQREVSFYRAHPVNEGNVKDSVHRAHSVNEGNVKDSVHRAHSVLSGYSVLTEFTRRLKDFTEFSVLTELSRLTQELIFEQSLPCWVGQ